MLHFDVHVRLMEIFHHDFQRHLILTLSAACRPR